ncbi:MAG: hypothetical protein QOI74_3102, partial [Micromonosporaceae bacterium]|nr:hypothetical protein [Micromonosporaceae bacterium]
RAAVLRNGYPADFPAVRDLDATLAVYTKLSAAAKAKDLDAVPDLYTELNTIGAQYNVDTPSNICPT